MCQCVRISCLNNPRHYKTPYEVRALTSFWRKGKYSHNIRSFKSIQGKGWVDFYSRRDTNKFVSKKYSYKVQKELEFEIWHSKLFQNILPWNKEYKIWNVKCRQQWFFDWMRARSKTKYKISIVTIVNKTNKIKHNMVNKLYWCGVYVTCCTTSTTSSTYSDLLGDVSKRNVLALGKLVDHVHGHFRR